MFLHRLSKAQLAQSLVADFITTNLIVTDADLTIVYVNDSLMKLLKEAESEIRRDLPAFDTAKLLGSSIDIFHKNPAHQRHILENLDKTYRATITIGGRPFDLVATPLKGPKGQRAGIAVEWSDAKLRLQNLEYAAQTAAISKAQAVIEFTTDGTIVTANANFLNALGYTLDEIRGQHHAMFMEASARNTPAYNEFWAGLQRGEYQTGEYKRVGKGGREVWILASYNPVLDQDGKPFKVVKFATDVTEQKLRTAEADAQIAAIGKAQAVIEFTVDGKVLTANDNFLRALGYSLDEIRNRHHSMFVDPAERNSDAYRTFWAALGRGEYQAAEYKRVGKDGRDVWIQASYNPILDLNGKPFKVVKYATDVTQEVIARMKNEHVCTMMESVAAGAEELNASVREISEAMVRSKETAAAAVDRVEAADQQAVRLSAAAESMSGIVQLIGDITGQINLLALNATIESARAGEAGRGFAVVAAEVKNLANQAKQATDKITTEIGTLNTISADVVGALSTIKQAIEGVSVFVTSTAAAVEEQSVVTGQMSSSMQQAAKEAASIGRAA